MSEDPQPVVNPVTPASTDAGQDVTLAKTTRLSDVVRGRLAEQARRTAQGAKARRVTSTDGQPGVADMRPLQQLFSELVEEMRPRIARALRQAADVIDPPVS